MKKLILIVLCLVVLSCQNAARKEVELAQTSSIIATEKVLIKIDKISKGEIKKGNEPRFMNKSLDFLNPSKEEVEELFKYHQANIPSQ